MITTAVDGGGNFFVTTDNPKKENGAILFSYLK